MFDINVLNKTTVHTEIKNVELGKPLTRKTEAAVIESINIGSDKFKTLLSEKSHIVKNESNPSYDWNNIQGMFWQHISSTYEVKIPTRVIQVTPLTETKVLIEYEIL